MAPKSDQAWADESQDFPVVLVKQVADPGVRDQGSSVAAALIWTRTGLRSSLPQPLRHLQIHTP